MCKRLTMRGAARLVAALALAGSGTRLHAQTQAEYRARVQELAPIWKSVSREARREDSLRIRALPKDTMRVEMLAVLAGPRLQSLAQAAATRAAAVLRQRFGELALELQPQLFTLTWPEAPQTDSATVNVGEIDSTGRATLTTGTPKTAEAVGAWLAQRGSHLLSQRLGSGFGRWLGDAIPLDTATRADWVGVRIDLVTSNFQASRECYAGNIESCEKALGLVNESDPVRGWFNSDERRGLVLHDQIQLRRGQEDAFDQCVHHRDATECMTLAEQIPTAEIQSPLGPASRQVLTRLAMQIGGTRAYARMRAAADTRGSQMAAAAGISVDSLTRVWRSRVVMTEAEQTTMTPGLALMSLVWVSGCGGLALGSSRWR